MFNRDKVLVFDNKSIPEVDSGDGCIALQINLMPLKHTF